MIAVAAFQGFHKPHPPILLAEDGSNFLAENSQNGEDLLLEDGDTDE